jgi:hypothetical protein
MLVVVAVGGSPAAGAELQQRAQLFSAQVTAWLGSTLGAHAQLLNMAVGGTGSDYFAFCADQHILQAPAPVDVVLLEHCVNAPGFVNSKRYPDKAQFLEHVVVTARRQHRRAVLVYACFPPRDACGSPSPADHADMMNVLRAHDVATVCARDLLNLPVDNALVASGRAARCPARRDVLGVTQATNRTEPL